VALIGLVIALLLAGAFYFLGPQKTQQNLTAYEQQLAAHQQVIATEPQKREALELAKKEVAEKKAAWARVERAKMPVIDLTKNDEESLTRTMIRLWQEPGRTVPLMERFALNTKDVIVTTNFGVGGQPTDTRALPRSMIEWPLGTISVQGSFQDIMRYMKRWNQAPRVVAVDNFQLQGTSPFLTGTASIVVYIFPRGGGGAQPQQQPGGFGGGYPGFGPGGIPGGGPGLDPFDPGIPGGAAGLTPGIPGGGPPGTRG
jgi:hypothetical protein